jgi:MFS family permease
MLVLDSSIVTIALPQAQQDLEISDADRQWVVTAYALAFGGLLLLGGRIADFAGRKRALHDRGCSWVLKPPVSSRDLAM